MKLSNTILITLCLSLGKQVIASPIKVCERAPEETSTAAFPDSSTCPADTPVSCSTTTDQDSCCYENPGGVVLLTQFWDYDPATGPEDEFTLHGLWPDNCDGTYEQYCNTSQQVDSMQSTLESFGETETLEKMNLVWKDYKGNDDDLWTHEFNKHGTCMSTIKPGCFQDYKEHQEAVDYVKKALELFETFPTYKWLTEAGIVPSESETYTKDAIIAALTAKHGYAPYINCDSNGALLEVWYFHHLQGSILNGKYIPMETLSTTKCPANIKFLPKGSSSSTTATSSSSAATSTSTSGSFKAFLKPKGQSGCLISNGKWYTTGTCAGYTVSEASFGGYELKTSKGSCGISGGDFTCGSDVTAAQFEYDSSTGLLSSGGSDTWYADSVPSGTTQVAVRPSGSGSVSFNLEVDPQ